jgi:hypothetical protein
LLGNGDGTFQAAQRYTVGGGPLSSGVGDFTGNGILDLTVANEGTTTVSMLLGNGNGTFQAKQDYTTMYHPTSLAVGDFNGDGFPDLVTTNYNQTLSVLLNAADWNDGSPAVSESPRLPPAPRPLDPDPLAARVAAPDPRPLHALAATVADQAPLPMVTDRNQPAQAGATSNATRLVQAPPAPEAALADWNSARWSGSEAPHDRICGFRLDWEPALLDNRMITPLVEERS